MTRVVDSNGVQVLPDLRSDRAEWSAYFVRLACDGDLRLKAPVYRQFADSLTVEVDS